MDCQKKIAEQIIENNADYILAVKEIRVHWDIENKLHWVLNVSFGEDASKKRRHNATQNFSISKK